MKAGRDDALIAAGVGLMCLTAFVVYWPAVHGEFIWDDFINILNNPLIRANTGLRDMWLARKGTFDYYPLTWTTWWLEWRAWRRDTTGYHVLNILLHAGAAAIWWRVLVRLGVPGAFVVALVFLVHPVNVESVAWITERKNTLSMPLLGAALALYLDSEEGRGRRELYWASVAVFVLSLLAKPASVALPAVLPLLAWSRRGRISWADVRIAIPFAVAAAAVAVTTVVVHHTRGIVAVEVRPDGFAARLAGSAWAVWFYLYKLAWPVNLTFIYPRWSVDPRNVIHWLPLVALVSTFAILFATRRFISRAPVTAMAYFVAMLLPVLGFIDVFMFRYSLVADHWQYHGCLAAIALVIGAVRLALRQAGRPGRVIGVTAAVAVCSTLAVLSWRQAHVYATRAALWTHAYKHNPNSAITLSNHANTSLVPYGRVEEGRALFRRAMEVEPGWREPYVAMGDTFARAGRHGEAVEWYRKAVGLNGGSKDPRVALAESLVELDQIDEAIKWYEEALAAEPHASTFHRRLAKLYEATGRAGRTLELYRESARLAPDDPEEWFVLGLALLRHKLPDEAASALAEARRLAGNDHALVHAMGTRLMVAGHPTIAAEAYEEAIRMKPDYGPAHNKLGEAMLALGRPADAAPHFERALEVQPGFRQASENLRRVREGVTTLPAPTTSEAGDE